MHGKREFNAAWQLPLWGISTVPGYALGYSGSDTALSGLNQLVEKVRHRSSSVDVEVTFKTGILSE